ncbi:winged helix-turn-helix domain-containing protein [Serratia sarumanii]|uniref:winged helix-turn-helix domain-containing protein n=1 Tax=Serratia sarumanii TaxID=3020826 RepID=UPI003F7DF8C1
MNGLINKYSKYENEKIKVENELLLLKSHNVEVRLTKKQKNLFLCLIGEVNNKKDIIRLLWGDNSLDNENKYNQLVFKLRENLLDAGFPKDTVITMYRYGICLNRNLLKSRKETLSMIHDEII